MAVNQRFLEFVEDSLKDLGNIEVKKMFGGAGVMFNGKMFAIVHGASLFFKTDDQLKGLYEEKGMERFQPFRKKMRMNYHEVPPEIIENSISLQTWARWSIDIAHAK